MKNCRYCGRENLEAATHCAECGTELVTQTKPVRPADRPRRTWRVPGIGYGALILALIAFYFLSFAPVMRLTGKSLIKLPATASSPLTSSPSQYNSQGGVGLVYYPAFWLSATVCSYLLSECASPTQLALADPSSANSGHK